MRGTQPEQISRLKKIVFTCLLLCFYFHSNGQYSTFQYSGANREYLYYTPSNLPVNSPLVVAVHGYTDDALHFQDYTKLNLLADSLGFAVCYPRGTLDHSGKRYWYVGYDFHKGDDIKDDCGFIETLAVYLQKKHNLNPTRTYITGMSNGGDMCIKIACDGKGVFKAFAPVVGCLMECIQKNSHYSPKPMLFINGTKDNTTYYAGDTSNLQGFGAYLDTPTMIQYFAKLNGCNQTERDTLPDWNKTDNSFIIREKHYQTKSDCNQVWFYQVVGGGHDWIGSSGNMDINAGTEIAKFFLNLPYTKNNVTKQEH